MVARRRVVSLSSWPGVSRPSALRRRGVDGRDTPYRKYVSLKRPGVIQENPLLSEIYMKTAVYTEISLSSLITKDVAYSFERSVRPVGTRPAMTERQQPPPFSAIAVPAPPAG